MLIVQLEVNRDKYTIISRIKRKNEESSWASNERITAGDREINSSSVAIKSRYNSRSDEIRTNGASNYVQDRRIRDESGP